MNMNEFSAKMTELLEIQKNCNRIKSENLLFRQQNDDLRQQLVMQDTKHRRELADIFCGEVQKISLAESQINKWREELEDMSNDISRSDERDMDNSNCCSSSYYVEERNRIEESSDFRRDTINAIIAALEEAAGIE